jgi:hypothetical protein
LGHLAFAAGAYVWYGQFAAPAKKWPKNDQKWPKIGQKCPKNCHLTSHFCRITSMNGFAALCSSPSLVCRSGITVINA